METSDTSSPRERIASVLWNAFGALGGSTWTRDGVQAVVDPEALIVLAVAIDDRRLVHETIDWGVLHADLLIPSRLRALGLRAGVPLPVANWIGQVASATRRASWKPPSDARLEPLELSGKSLRVTSLGSWTAAQVAMRVRLVSGATIRSEVVRAFHASASSQHEFETRQVAELSAATTRQVRPILDDLVAAGLLANLGTQRRARFVTRNDSDFSRATWRAWADAPPAPWQTAVAVLPTLLQVHDTASRNGSPTKIAAALDDFLGLEPRLLPLTHTALPPIDRRGSELVAAQLAQHTGNLIDSIAALLTNGSVHLPSL